MSGHIRKAVGLILSPLSVELRRSQGYGEKNNPAFLRNNIERE